MAQIVGKVATVRKDGQGFKIGDDWYRLGTRSSPAYAPEWKSTVVVVYMEQADEKGRPERFVDSWQGESAASPSPRRANDGVAESSPGVDRPDWDARLAFDKERHPVVTREAVMNTTVAIWTIAERLADNEMSSRGEGGPPSLTAVSALALALRQAMMRDFLALEAFAKTGEAGLPVGQKVGMVEAAIAMGAEVEPTLRNDMPAWANEPRTDEQAARLTALLKQHGLRQRWVVEQGYTLPLNRYDAECALEVLTAMGNG